MNELSLQHESKTWTLLEFCTISLGGKECVALFFSSYQKDFLIVLFLSKTMIEIQAFGMPFQYQFLKYAYLLV